MSKDMVIATAHYELELEIDSYLRGFGNVPTLIKRLRAAPLVVPVDAEGFIATFAAAPGVAPAQWRMLAAFSEMDTCRSFARSMQPRQYGKGQWRYLALSGTSLLDEYLPKLHRATSLMINPTGKHPFLLPPTTEFMPNATWAIDLDADDDDV